MRIDIEPQAKRMEHLQDRGQAGVSLFAEGFVKSFTGNACIPGKLHHSARAGNVAQRSGEQGGIVGRLVDACLQVDGAVFIGLQLVSGIERPDAKFFSGLGVHRSFH